MPTQRVEIGPKHLVEARQAAEARSFTTSDPLVFADVIEKGLLLRVQVGSAGWVLKWNGRTRSLGKLDDVKSAKAARELAKQVRALLKDGTDPTPFLDGKAAGKTNEAAVAQAERQTLAASGKWTWETLVDRYVSYLSEPRITSRGVVKTPSLATAAEAKRYLSQSAVATLNGRLVSELGPGDLEEVRDCAARDGSKSASRQFVAYARAALTIARRKHSRAAGLEGVPKWWLEVEKLEKTIPLARNRHPTVAELAKVLWIAETRRVMPGRKAKRGTSDSVLCSFWFIALTGQRVGAGLALEKAHVLPWPDGPEGWRVVFFPGHVMKAGRPHAIPVPPRVVLLIERSIAAAAHEDSKFVFPTVRTVGEDSDRPMTKSSVARLLERLRGRPADLSASRDEEEATAKPLLGDMAHFSIHDLRRTFATACGDLAVRGDAVSAVLDHIQDMGFSGRFAPAGRTADITRLAYDFSQRLELKRIAMEAWTTALFEACDKEWASHRPRLPRIRSRDSGPPPWMPWYEVEERKAAARAQELALRPRLRLDLRNLRDTSEDSEQDDDGYAPDDV